MANIIYDKDTTNKPACLRFIHMYVQRKVTMQSFYEELWLGCTEICNETKHEMQAR